MATVAKSTVRLRDSRGHFIRGTSVKSQTKMSSVGNVPIVPEFEKPLLQVSISNPFKKILYWLDQIRKHQTTTFAIKLSIPLIALPVIVGAAFSLGKVSGISLQNSPITSIAPEVSTSSVPLTVSKAGILKIAKGETKTTYLLSLRNGELQVLEVPENINLSRYSEKQILVTGTLNKSTNVLKISDIAQVEIFNSTVVATSSAAQ